MTLDEKLHTKTRATLDRLDRQSIKVALGFIIFWILYTLAWAVAIFYFFL